MAEQEQKQELVETARTLPAPPGGFDLRPRTFEEAYRFANLMAQSDLLPKEFQGKPANVLVAVQLGMELGVSPMQALQNMYVVNGKPAIYGDLLPAIVFQSGLLESIKEEGDEKSARCTVKRKGHEAISRTFTWEDAKRAKTKEYGNTISLAEKSTYQSYPKRMLQMRARAWAIRDMFPDVLKGVAIREEVEDSIETTATHVEDRPQITPPQPLRKEPPHEERTAEAQGASEADRQQASTDQSSPKSDEGKADAFRDGAEAAQRRKVGRPPKKEKPDEQQSNPTESPGDQKVSEVAKVDEGQPGDAPVGDESEAEGNEAKEAQGEKGEWLADRLADETVAIADRILDWAENAPMEEILSNQNFLLENFSKLPKGEPQLRALRAFNDRKRSHRDA